jgi:hypothetical protein
LAKSVGISVAVLGSFSLGYEIHRREWVPLPVRQYLLRLRDPEEAPPGWSFAHERLRSARPSPGARAIGTLGYLGGYTLATESKDVTTHDPRRASGGVNLYVSGHAPEAILMDMAGTVLHRWRHDFRAEWPDAGPCRIFGDEGQRYWRRAHLFENGDLLAIYEGFALVKLDKNSHVLWTRYAPYHHDLEVAPDGRIFVLDRDVRHRGRWEADVEDFVAVLSPDGDPLKRVSILECFDRSRFAPMLEQMPRVGDGFHTNTLQVLDGSAVHGPPAFRAGNVLVSIRQLNIVATLDLEAEEVVWALGGLWKRQHQPELLPGPRLLVFDNQGNAGKSRVIELDPFTQEILWAYSGEGDAPLDSHVLGSCQRLPNGNTLITESTRGRAIEVTPAGEIVWEFHNPHRAGERGELVANLCEVIRLGPEFPMDCMGRGSVPETPLLASRDGI